MNINKEKVELVIEKLELEKAFYIDLGQTAVIGNFTILFEQCVGEWSEDIEGNQEAAFNTYYLSLSEENEQKTISFISPSMSNKNELWLEWKNYKILVLEDSEKTLKLLVFKED